MSAPFRFDGFLHTNIHVLNTRIEYRLTQIYTYSILGWSIDLRYSVTQKE